MTSPEGEKPSPFGSLGSNLINAALGGLILWVGQTAFRHEGTLTNVDEKIAGISHQVDEVNQRYESLRNYVASVTDDLKSSNRVQFTNRDGEKLLMQLRQTEHSATELERRIAERLHAFDIKLATLECSQRGSQEVSALQIEIANLRSELARAVCAYQAQLQTQPQVQAPTTIDGHTARGVPVYLPPVDRRR